MQNCFVVGDTSARTRHAKVRSIVEYRKPMCRYLIQYAKLVSNPVFTFWMAAAMNETHMCGSNKVQTMHRMAVSSVLKANPSASSVLSQDMHRANKCDVASASKW